MSKGRISPEFLQKVKDAVNIIDVIGEHVVLRKSGSNFTGLCPFHNERSPSFSVSEQKQLYHCYGCKKGGDLVNFVREIHGLSFAEAVEELADRASLPLPKDFERTGDEANPEVAKKRAEIREKTATAFKLNRFSAKFFREQLSLPAGAHIAEYFRKRGVGSQLSQSFYLGAAPASWDGLASFLAKAKAPLPLAAELGLIKASPKETTKGPGFFDLFRNRAMFPILDLRGKVVGFGGRGLPTPANAPDVGGESPKYLNSSESMLFFKSKIAYGLFQAQKHIREKDEVILVEGYFDVLALHAGGFENAVATCGTSLTEDHLQLFRKFASKITVLFDGDRAGITATDRAMELGLKNGLILHGASLPDGLDPDEILFEGETGESLPEGKLRMAEILGRSGPLLDSRIESARVFSLKGTEERTKAVKQVGEWLSLLKDPVGREIRMDKVCQDFSIGRSLLEQAMAAAKPARSSTPRVVAPPNPGQTSIVLGAKNGASPVPKRRAASQKPSQKETILVRGILRGGNFRSMLEESRAYLPEGLPVHELADHPSVRKVIDALIDRGISSEALIASIALGEERTEVGTDGDTEPFDPLIATLLNESQFGGDAPNTAPFTEGEFRIAVQRGLSHSWARFSQELKRKIRDAELKKDAELRERLAKEYLDVQRRIKEFGTFYDEV
ncbi:MAG: DNA primase [Cryobacterium sp.]|nr:DNA primase [Oligoflexia bacterium]